MAYSLTREEILKELVKCGKNPAYFINNYALSLGFIKIAKGINTQYPNIKMMGASFTDW